MFFGPHDSGYLVALQSGYCFHKSLCCCCNFGVVMLRDAGGIVDAEGADDHGVDGGA